MAGLLCLGMGFCAEALALRLKGQGWEIVGTVRSQARIEELGTRGFRAVTLDRIEETGILSATPLHVLISAPPDERGDPALRACGERLANAPSRPAWVGYLSTTGVYGDHGGGWVDEETPTAPQSDRARRRIEAEEAWLSWGRAVGAPVHVFRLAGIYGPGRNQLVSLREGTARRIDKPGQVFSRIHVDDIAEVLLASIRAPRAGRIYNVCDDEPAPPQEVVAYAATLLGMEPPPLEAYEQVRSKLSPMAASFYLESKRVSNRRIRDELGVRLAYPTYREGLSALQRDSNPMHAPEANRHR
jgi:nucleoside-diphosphate-sugar epimerase